MKMRNPFLNSWKNVMVDVDARDMELIKDILQRYVSRYEVRVFGSRVSGHSKKHSDLDIAVVSETKIPRKTIIQLKEAFQEAPISMRIDVLDWSRVSASFQNVINRKYETLQRPH